MSGAWRRVVAVLAGYAVVSLAVLAVASWARPVLALPVLFSTLLWRLILLGLPISLLIAWHYPRIGHHGERPGDG